MHVIDSANLSTGIGLQVLYAAELAASGKDAKDIVKAVSSIICYDIITKIKNRPSSSQNQVCFALIHSSTNIPVNLGTLNRFIKRLHLHRNIKKARLPSPAKDS